MKKLMAIILVVAMIVSVVPMMVSAGVAVSTKTIKVTYALDGATGATIDVYAEKPTHLATGTNASGTNVIVKLPVTGTDDLVKASNLAAVEVRTDGDIASDLYVVVNNVPSGYEVSKVKSSLTGKEVKAAAVQKWDDTDFFGPFPTKADTKFTIYLDKKAADPLTYKIDGGSYYGTITASRKFDSGTDVKVTLTWNNKNGLPQRAKNNAWIINDGTGVDNKVTATGNGIYGYTSTTITFIPKELYAAYSDNGTGDVEIRVVPASSKPIAAYANYTTGGTVTVTYDTANSKATIKATVKKGYDWDGWYIENNSASETVVINPTINPGGADVAMAQTLTVAYTDDTKLTFEAQFVPVTDAAMKEVAALSSGSSTNPKTADDSNVVLWTLIAIVALGGVAFAAKKVTAK